MTSNLTINLPTGNVEALCYGPENAPPILATHGWLDNAASFAPIGPLLESYRVIAVDLPGHGLSTHRPPEAYFHFIDYVTDVIAIIDYFGWPQCGLLGHSMGAAIMSLVAAIIPERVKSLGLLDLLGPMAIATEELPDLARLSISQTRKLPSKQLPRYDSLEAAIQARLKASNMALESVKLLVERGTKSEGDKFTWRTDPRLMVKPMIMFDEPQVHAFLKRITAPTCLILPTSGSPMPESVTQARMLHVKDLVCFEVAGQHHVHMDNPVPVAQHLNQFFSTHLLDHE